MTVSAHRYFALHKPHNMVSQFVSSHAVRLLSDLDFAFPPGTHAIGRLDRDSEGLLVLTTDKSVTRRLFGSELPHRRTYLVQVKYVLSEAKLEQLRTGVPISAADGAVYVTKPCAAQVVARPSWLEKGATEIAPEHPHTWLQLTLTEGKFHQVRKMVAALGHPCRRLIRTAIEDLTLAGLPPGGVRELEAAVFFQLLKL